MSDKGDCRTAPATHGVLKTAPKHNWLTAWQQINSDLEAISGARLQIRKEGVIDMDCLRLHCSALHCTAWHYTALNCNTLHYTAFRCNALHYTDVQWSQYVSGPEAGALNSSPSGIKALWTLHFTLHYIIFYYITHCPQCIMYTCFHYSLHISQCAQ